MRWINLEPILQSELSQKKKNKPSYCVTKHTCRYAAGLPWWLSGKESACQCRRRGFNPWVGQISWRRKWQPTPGFLPGESHGQRILVGYSPWGVSDGKASAYNAGDLGLIPGLGRSPGEGNGNPLQYSCLENPMDGGTW